MKDSILQIQEWNVLEREWRLTPLSESKLVTELKYKGSVREVKAGTGYRGRM